MYYVPKEEPEVDEEDDDETVVMNSRTRLPVESFDPEENEDVTEKNSDAATD